MKVKINYVVKKYAEAEITERMIWELYDKFKDEFQSRTDIARAITDAIDDYINEQEGTLTNLKTFVHYPTNIEDLIEKVIYKIERRQKVKLCK